MRVVAGAGIQHLTPVCRIAERPFPPASLKNCAKSGRTVRKPTRFFLYLLGKIIAGHDALKQIGNLCPIAEIIAADCEYSHIHQRA